MGNDTNTGAGSQTTTQTDPNGQTPTSQSQTASGTQKTPLDSLPADVQEYIRSLRVEAEEANKAKRAAAKAKQEAEEARLKEQGEFKTLAEKHEARVKELEPVSERYSALSGQVNSQIDAEIKQWPEEIRALDPGPGAPIEGRLEWIAKARPLVEKISGAAMQRAMLPGSRPNPQPMNSAQARQAAIEANKQDLKKGRTYGL